MRIQAKICGLSTPETVDAAIAAGASHIGLMHFPKSPRHVPLDTAAALRRRLPGTVKAAVVLVNPDGDLLDAVINQIRPDIIQLHGDETPEQIAQWQSRFGGLGWYKALAIRTASDLVLAQRYAPLQANAPMHILYDAKPPKDAVLPGGNGVRFDWNLLVGHRHALPWILSGGLDAQNVAEAVAMTGASFVDISSGVESAPGHKDIGKIRAFLDALRPA